MTDGVEDYTAFSTGLPDSQLGPKDNIGNWTTVNANEGACYVMQVAGAYLQFPNANTPASFIVFDAENAGVPEKVLNNWTGHDGSKQAFLAMATIGEANDKWLISPLLSGNGQEIKFFARSPITDYGLESFEVLYSTDGKETADFIKVGEVKAAVPQEWTEYSYTLPEGARYFAIRSTSDDVYALLVDDISFEMAHPHNSLELAGYHVYRDNRQATTEPVSATEHYIVEPSAEGSHVYNVTAMYSTGESAPSNSVSVDLSSIGEISGGEIQITTEKESILIRNASGEKIRICDIDGIVHFCGNACNGIRISLHSGIYIVDINGKSAAKVYVK